MLILRLLEFSAALPNCIKIFSIIIKCRYFRGAFVYLFLNIYIQIFLPMKFPSVYRKATCKAKRFHAKRTSIRPFPLCGRLDATLDDSKEIGLSKNTIKWLFLNYTSFRVISILLLLQMIYRTFHNTHMCVCFSE